MQRLENIFLNVNDWLKFAETKNGVIAAFNSTIALAILNALIDKKIVDYFLQKYLTFSVVFLLGSAFISLISFLPQLTILRFKKNKNVTKFKNLLFFGDIALFTGEEYLKEIEQRYGVIGNEDKNYKLDVSEQITTNARIALIKYRCFIIALWVDLVIFMTPLVLLLIPIWKLITGKKK